jgi:hypothetical protein
LLLGAQQSGARQNTSGETMRWSLAILGVAVSTAQPLSRIRRAPWLHQGSGSLDGVKNHRQIFSSMI